MLRDHLLLAVESARAPARTGAGWPCSARVGGLGLVALGAALALSGPGCKAHSGAGGRLELGGSASAQADGDAEANVEGNASANATSGQEAPKKPKKTVKISAVRFCGGELEYEGTIDFAYNADALEGDGTFKALGNLRDFLQKNEGIKITVEGHTDSRGSPDYNRALSKRRAASVRKWLIDNGIDKARVDSVGYGEDKPKVDEPPECKNKVPLDKSPCEEAWAKNRRSVFTVVEGKDSMSEQCGGEPEPAPEAEEPPPPPKPAEPPPKPDTCPTDLVGFHINGLGPNTWVNAEVAIQPLCWLELSAGLGYKQGDVDASVPEGKATGSYKAFTIPARGRIWFLRKHSPILDLGLGLTRYTIDASARASTGQQVDYSFDPYRFVGFGGIGYGYRSDGPFRLALLIGGLVHTKNNRPFYATSDAKPYGEISLGWLF